MKGLAHVIVRGLQFRRIFVYRKALKKIKKDHTDFDYYHELGMLLDGYLNTRLFETPQHLFNSINKYLMSKGFLYSLEKPKQKPSLYDDYKKINWNEFNGKEFSKVLSILDLTVSEFVSLSGLTKSTAYSWARDVPPTKSVLAYFQALIFIRKKNWMNDFKDQMHVLHASDLSKE